ncbi:outer membrane beta-barrel protein [Pedobacter sp. Leaf176]|uniref:outer membrane beta-barrel protein n=1 Tax=Pedobacter sp. Leaf176 TaxID=1736286 RepID=UPI0006F618B2|nr:outer membrane beta-barrel protein [Pedobacter sp. Leaf176]KQR72281.1 hypothetical protein ASF92_03015 [Pedobacter sp. Leaf176]
MKKGNDIDKLFRAGLEQPDIPFNDAHWQAMEERLHPKQKRRITPVTWWAALSGLAAMLLIVFFVIKPDDEKSNPGLTVRKKVEKNNEHNADDKVQVENQKGLTIEKNKGLIEGKQILVDAIKSIAKNPGYENLAKTENLSNPNLRTLLVTNNLLMNTISSSNLPLTSYSNQIAEFIGRTNILIEPAKPRNKVSVKTSGNRPRFVLSVLAGPDLTSVNHSGQSNLSGSFGAELTFSLTKRLSITTGAAYGKKIYESDFSLYKPNSSYVFRTEPTNVHANCDVLDIPLNLNYKIFDGRKNSLSVSTGLSSYLMLKEKYSYTYNSAYPGPADYEVKNQNQHYLGIANVGVEFQHKISSKLSISARPFMKIPLTDIGYGNSKLSSTGVAVSVNMNLFRKSN